MSLITEALRKAQATQRTGATADTAVGPVLHPVQGGRSQSHSIISLPFIAAVVLALAGIMFWAWYHAGRVDLLVRANSRLTATSPVTKPETTTPAVTPAAAPVEAPANPVAQATPSPSPEVANRVDVAPANEAPVAAPAPAPVVYHLEGIFFSPKHPAAVINGDTVYVGGLVGDARVQTIEPESVTVVTMEGQTNVLVLTR